MKRRGRSTNLAQDYYPALVGFADAARGLKASTVWIVGSTAVANKAEEEKE
jgi:hypothetical protein